MNCNGVKWKWVMLGRIPGAGGRDSGESGAKESQRCYLPDRSMWWQSGRDVTWRHVAPPPQQLRHGDDVDDVTDAQAPVARWPRRRCDTTSRRCSNNKKRLGLAQLWLRICDCLIGGIWWLVSSVAGRRSALSHQLMDRRRRLVHFLE